MTRQETACQEACRHAMHKSCTNCTIPSASHQSRTAPKEASRSRSTFVMAQSPTFSTHHCVGSLCAPVLLFQWSDLGEVHPLQTLDHLDDAATLSNKHPQRSSHRHTDSACSADTELATAPAADSRGPTRKDEDQATSHERPCSTTNINDGANRQHARTHQHVTSTGTSYAHPPQPPRHNARCVPTGAPAPPTEAMIQQGRARDGTREETPWRKPFPNFSSISSLPDLPGGNWRKLLHL